MEDDGVVIVVRLPVPGAGVAGPLGGGAVAVGNDAVQVLGDGGVRVEGSGEPRQEAVQDLAGAGRGTGDRDVAADRARGLRAEAGAEGIDVAALQGSDISGDDVARFLGTHGSVLSLVSVLLS